MRHDFHIEGYAFALRPVVVDDARFIVELRTHEQRNKHLHTTSSDVGAQKEWLKSYFEREGDFYFVIERLDPARREGLVSISNFQDTPRTAEWGRWILVPGSLAAPESALLVYRIAFDVLSLDEIYCRTSAQNASVVSFHDSTGLAKRAVLKDHFDLGGRRYDAVEHVLTRDRWPAVSDRLTAVAQRVARRTIRHQVTASHDEP